MRGTLSQKAGSAGELARLPRSSNAAWGLQGWRLCSRGGAGRKVRVILDAARHIFLSDPGLFQHHAYYWIMMKKEKLRTCFPKTYGLYYNK